MSKILTKKSSPYLAYLIIELALIGVVFILFKNIPDPKIASVIAGTLFCVIPLGILISESRKSRLNFTFWTLSLSQFLFFFALPVLLKRLTNWNTDFKEIYIWGISGPLFHKLSHGSFLIMIFATGLMYYKQKRKV